MREPAESRRKGEGWQTSSTWKQKDRKVESPTEVSIQKLILKLKTEQNRKQYISMLVQNIKVYTPPPHTQTAKHFLKKLSDGDWEPGQGGTKGCFSIVNLIIL